jgi:hypothetical protein
MKMSCKVSKELIYAYSDNEIDTLEKIFIEEHLKYCEKCNEELKMIKLIESNLNNLEHDIKLPKRLSNLSELVAINCIARDGENNRKLKIFDYLKDITSMSAKILQSQKLSYDNPYNRFIKKGAQITTKALGKPIKNYYKKKVSELSLLKHLKVG